MDDQSDTVPATEFESWLTPLEAEEMLRGVDWPSRRRAILDRLAAGLIVAAAETYRWNTYSADEARELWIVPQRVWSTENAPSPTSSFWETAQFKFAERKSNRSDVAHSYFGVRFEPMGIAKLAKASGLTGTKEKPSFEVPPVVQERNKGGAPRKGWWDDLWIEMIRRIRADELHPESAADLQRKMMDWLGEQGFYPGDDTLKKTAIKLFKYLQE